MVDHVTPILLGQFPLATRSWPERDVEMSHASAGMQRRPQSSNEQQGLEAPERILLPRPAKPRLPAGCSLALLHRFAQSSGSRCDMGRIEYLQHVSG